MNTRAQAPRVPDRAAPEGLEAKWGEAWEDQGTYAFDRTATREQVYSIDTPPPTVSGSLHIGHVFSYTHTDVVARYQRMMGKSVFYPMGWDDNGLPTERRVQNYFGVRVDATLPYDPDFEPPHVGGDGKSIKARDQKPISRKNFVELCERLTVEDEAQFEALWRYLGLSVDWKQNYQTIGARARKVAQAAFLRNLARGEAYQAEAPGLWDVTFQTAVAQAELESREYPGFYHRLAFHITDAEAAAKAAAAGAPVEDGVDVCIETTRPELLAACVALIAHPDDERYKPLFGTTVASPVYGVEVPILPHPEAEMDKGAGIAMCCTFGDTTDIDWWRDLELPLRAILRKDGRIITDARRPHACQRSGGQYGRRRQPRRSHLHAERRSGPGPEPASRDRPRTRPFRRRRTWRAHGHTRHRLQGSRRRAACRAGPAWSRRRHGPCRGSPRWRRRGRPCLGWLQESAPRLQSTGPLRAARGYPCAAWRRC